MLKIKYLINVFTITVHERYTNKVSDIGYRNLTLG